MMRVAPPLNINYQKQHYYEKIYFGFVSGLDADGMW